MRILFLLISLASLGCGGWYAWENVPQLRALVQQTLNRGDLCTLEVRYTAEEIMRTHKERLLKNNGYSYLEPKILYYPYLLMDVKYSKDFLTTCEGTLLWGLNDGEMVVDTATWTRTHGFEDCLLSKADRNDFKVIGALMENGGTIDREKLYQRFKVDRDILDDWIDSACAKKLVVISGNKFRLHFESPRLETQPVTILNEEVLVTQPVNQLDKVQARYSPSQIKTISQIAFGGDFAIRKTQEVFLPVYQIGIRNPDGSTRTLYFNALNGKNITIR